MGGSPYSHTIFDWRNIDPQNVQSSYQNYCGYTYQSNQQWAFNPCHARDVEKARKRAEKIAKLRVLMERGATEGEREAARAALDRVSSAS